MRKKDFRPKTGDRRPETGDPVQISELLPAVRDAAAVLRTASSDRKNAVLGAAAELLSRRHGDVLAANREDLDALSTRATPAFRDRLLLNENRIRQMVESLGQVAGLPDPAGEEIERRTLPNGLLLRRVRTPLGVILMIFESRPNVAIEAFSLAFKAGNGIILRGGKESMRTTGALYAILEEALETGCLPRECVWGVTDPDRKLVRELLARGDSIDVVVPRGGEQLIDFVTRNTRIPVIRNDRGLCHVYVHADADPGMAAAIVENAKTQRPGVCNAMETLLVHEAVAAALLPSLHERLSRFGVEWFGCPRTREILSGRGGVKPAAAASWDTEYLDLKMSCRVVSGLEEALSHIAEHGSRHSEAIVTRSEEVARAFQSRVDAAAVYWNASTRFTDGFELGLGGELGISTQKLHARGPVGLRELTSARWIIDGNGQTRG